MGTRTDIESRCAMLAEQFGAQCALEGTPFTPEHAVLVRQWLEQTRLLLQAAKTRYLDQAGQAITKITPKLCTYPLGSIHSPALGRVTLDGAPLYAAGHLAGLGAMGLMGYAEYLTSLIVHGTAPQWATQETQAFFSPDREVTAEDLATSLCLHGPGQRLPYPGDSVQIETTGFEMRELFKQRQTMHGLGG